MTEQPPSSAESLKPQSPAATILAAEPVEAEVNVIVRWAVAEGMVTNADLAERLSVPELTPDKADAVYKHLLEIGVEIVEDEALVEEDEEEEAVAEAEVEDPDERRRRERREIDEAPLKAPTNDPVRMYLKEIGKVALLTAQEEVDLAKRIEAGVLATERLENGTERTDRKSVV